ncbi:alanine/glycine:cation symporter family protein [Luteimonas sp. RD2P54]|uniref:Alanine/glycine:cation symporter family protein n=1 Tax=Luteimonas endophytica TaxID=3042023 RepID=A0ABT6J4J4_9GAMM|nr:alanine/glycine:cation symporter family protein [Luteimonas endophytica]MDH5821525.1 alanine/glycine:cation symporter family protein [Luteimonas endophytica]
MTAAGRVLAALLALAPAAVSAAPSSAPGLDETINNAFAPVAAAVSWVVFHPVPIGFGASLPFVVLWLLVAALGFTLYFRFINLRGFAQGFRLIRGDFSRPDDPGEVTHFQALATALSGTVGLGNIAGVAIAISIGGPGATFWMIVAGLLGMSSKFAECTLGVKYRRINADGTVSGGPMYYLSRGLAEQRPSLAGLGKVLAVVFSICCIGGSLGAGNMFQSNQSFQQILQVSGGADSWLAGKGWLFGLIMAVLVAVVIIGGLKSIARVTGKLVPVMAIFYFACGLYIIGADIGNVGPAFRAIFDGAFTPEAGYGGFIGVLIQGFRRAAFSNEAGVGSAAIAHSASRTSEPASEGLVALWEPFIDTVVICTMTALVIVITGMYQVEGVGDGVQLTSMAYASVLSWFPYLLAVSVLLFAFSTMLAWSYYGEKAACYLFGESRAVALAYKLLFCVFVVIGASANLGVVMDFSDAMILVMSVPNLIGVYLLAPVVRREVEHYLQRVRSGEIRNYRRQPVAG